MGLFRLFLFLLLVGVMECSISSPFGGTRVFSRRQVAEINTIAEASMEEELRKSLEEDEETPVYVEPTPPPLPEATTPTSDIETIRRNISASEAAVECNITAKYLWELCRPVLLRTCKEEYRTRCRADPRRNMLFSRRLGRIFPSFRPPKLPVFKLEPILEWFEDQISNLNSSTGFQFTITITSNNDTVTYTNEQAVRHFPNMNNPFQFHTALRNMREKYGRNFRNFPHPRHRQRKPFGDWMTRFWGDDDEDEREDERDEEEPVVVPARRVDTAEEQEEEEVEEEERTSAKTGRYNPSVIVPKRGMQKVRRRKVHSRQKRHFRQHMSRSPHNTMRTDANRHRFMGPPSRFWNNRVPHLSHQNIHTRHSSYMPRIRIPEFHHRPPPRVHHFPHYPHYPHYPHIPMMKPHHLPSFFGGNDDNEDDDDEEDDNEDDDDEDEYCREMEQNPEACLEIAERTEKCENELERVCPEYVATRRRIKEQLDNVYSTRHQFTQTSTSTGEEETNESYQWASEIGDYERPIVIESIKINRRGSGDAFVTAKLFDEVEVNFRVPASDFSSDPKSLGEAIGKRAVESYDSFARARPEDP